MVAFPSLVMDTTSTLLPAAMASTPWSVKRLTRSVKYHELSEGEDGIDVFAEGEDATDFSKRV